MATLQSSKTKRAGQFVRQQSGTNGYSAFVPAPLPPQPSILFNPPIQSALESASRALGRLDGVTLLLPDPTLFMYTYIRKEAVLSSQIEGTQSTLSDLLLFDNDVTPNIAESDVSEVSNYRAAMQHGLDRLKNGFPLSLRLIREIHEILVHGIRGGDKAPGEFRKTQNWIGGTRPGNAAFVPPPPHEVMKALGNLEKFLHDDSDYMPTLIRAGIAHAQFETIHPFLDGNGRVGRLLITLLLCERRVLDQPLLYLSLYLKKHKQTYYEALQRIRTHGEWEEWILFYLEGIDQVALEATETAKHLIALFERDRQRIQKAGRATSAPLAVHELLKHRAITTIKIAAKQCAMSFPTASAALQKLVNLDIVREGTGRSRDRVFVYSGYLDALN